MYSSTFYCAVICAPQDIKVDLLIKTLIDGGKIRLVLIVHLPRYDGWAGVLVHDVAAQGRVLDAVGLPRVLPDVGQLARPHIALLKLAFQTDNMPMSGHHVSIK